MDKPWDRILRRLVRANPQAFVDLVFPGARYISMLPEKLTVCSLEVDNAIVVEVRGQEVIVNLEIQAYSDADMANRLMRYNILLKHEYKRPVVSRVVYLLSGTGGAVSPWYWHAPCYGDTEEDEEVFRFFFKSVVISKLRANEIIYRNEAVLYPLLPLTEGGTSQAIVEWMLTTLEAHHSADLALTGFMLAALVFGRTDQADKLEWLERRYSHMYDIIRESPAYHWITRDARKEGLKQGHKDGAVALRQAIMQIVQKRFPALSSLAEQQIAAVTDLALLQNSVVAISLASDDTEARQVLLHIQA